MAIKTAGIATITLQFESQSSQGFGKFSDSVQDEAKLLIDRLTALGLRGVDVIDSDVLIGQTFVLVDSNGATPAADVEDEAPAAPAKAAAKRAPKAAATAVEDEEAPAPKRRGRPPGTKNKPKAEAPTPAPKRGPKGPKRRA